MADSDQQADSDGKKALSSEAGRVMRGKGTEAPFTGAYWDCHDSGTYRCASCGHALFSSDEKFDSGTGWPSYRAPASTDSVLYAEDESHGMHRTEVTCKNCGAHLGHVFDDGPLPGGKRYCINSVALDLERKKGTEQK